MKFLIIPILFLLVSCLPSTVVELKNESAGNTFILDDSYQVVYRDINKYLNRCVPGGLFAATNDVNGNVYSELREADLTVRTNNMGDKSVMVFVELRAIGDKTEVIAYSADIGIWKDYSRVIERHLKTGTNTCE